MTINEEERNELTNESANNQNNNADHKEAATMRTMAVSLSRSYAAFAVQFVGTRRLLSTMLSIQVDFPKRITTSRCYSPPSCSTSHRPSRLFSSTTRTTVVDFEPPEPPGTHGTPVFPDIELATASTDGTGTTATLAAARTRNNDPNAVFVVTGASRGLGREFVHQLLARTKVITVAVETIFPPPLTFRPTGSHIYRDLLTLGNCDCLLSQTRRLRRSRG
jgi:hypothetical protein